MRVLTGSDVADMASMSTMIDAVEEAYRLLGTDAAIDSPRETVAVPELAGSYKSLPAAARGVGSGGFYYTGGFPGESASMTTLLFDPADGGIVALIESGRLSWLRTGATSAVATDHCAPPGVDTLGLIGSGTYARTQLTGVAAVRNLDEVRVYSPTVEHRNGFVDEMADEVDAELRAVETPGAAVAGADVVCTATTATDPVFDGADLSTGAHINAIGSHYPDQREVDTATVEQSRVIADSVARAREEDGELLIPASQGRFSWNDAIDLGDIVVGDRPGRRSPDETTLFTSGGLGIEYLLAGRYVYDCAVEAGCGTELDVPVDTFGG